MELDAILSVTLADDQARVAQIGNNIANISTPGYKRQGQLSSAFSARFDQYGLSTSQIDVEHTRRSSSTFEARAGAMKATGRDQDVYVETGGYLQMQTPTGIAYSRQAVLRIDVEGRLVNEAGYPVRCSGSDVLLPSKDFSVSESGEVKQGGVVVTTLRTYAPVDTKNIRPVGSGLYVFPGEVEESGHSQFKLGYVEGSNVDTSQEMVELLETTRHFESLQKVTQAYAELHDKAARYLGEF